MGVHCCDEGALRGDDGHGGGGVACGRSGYVGGASPRTEAIERGWWRPRASAGAFPPAIVVCVCFVSNPTGS